MSTHSFNKTAGATHNVKRNTRLRHSRATMFCGLFIAHEHVIVE